MSWRVEPVLVMVMLPPSALLEEVAMELWSIRNVSSKVILMFPARALSEPVLAAVIFPPWNTSTLRAAMVMSPPGPPALATLYMPLLASGISNGDRIGDAWSGDAPAIVTVAPGRVSVIAPAAPLDR